MAPNRTSAVPTRAATHYDLVVLGAGSAGLGAAQQAVLRGARVLVATDGEPGGECTFTGCVPSKTLLESARAGLGFDAAMRRVRDVVAEIAATENADVLRAGGIEVCQQRARFIGDRRLRVGQRSITAAGVVLATGSRPFVRPIPGLTEVDYLTNENVFELSTAPESMVVLGGGAVGCELAQAFARLGVAVTLIEQRPRVLGDEEAEASEVLTAALSQDGVRMRLGVRVTSVEPSDRSGSGATGAGGVRVVAGDEVVEAERILLATGRTPSTQDLGPEAAGVRLDTHAAVRVDPWLRTMASGVWAAGDVTARFAYTHVAYAMGRLAEPRWWRALGRHHGRRTGRGDARGADPGDGASDVRGPAGADHARLPELVVRGAARGRPVLPAGERAPCSSGRPRRPSFGSPVTTASCCERRRLQCVKPRVHGNPGAGSRRRVSERPGDRPARTAPPG